MPETVLTLEGMRVWTADKGLSEKSMRIVCVDKPSVYKNTNLLMQQQNHSEEMEGGKNNKDKESSATTFPAAPQIFTVNATIASIEPDDNTSHSTAGNSAQTGTLPTVTVSYPSFNEFLISSSGNPNLNAELSASTTQSSDAHCHSENNNNDAIAKKKRDFVVLPGFIDSHVHFFDGGRRKTALNLSQCRSKADLIAAIRRHIRERLLSNATCTSSSSSQNINDGPFTPAEAAALNAYKHTNKQREGDEGEGTSSKVPRHNNNNNNNTNTMTMVPWVVGFQWNDVQLGGVPNKRWLDEALLVAGEEKKDAAVDDTCTCVAITIDVPIILVRFDCHSCVVNSCALRLSGIDAYGPPDPEGGKIDRWGPLASPSPSSLPSSSLCGEREGDEVKQHEKKGGNEKEEDKSQVEARVALGEPTGYLRERAIMIVHKKRRETWDVSSADLAASYDAAAEELLRNGVTSCFSMTSLDYDNIKEFEFLLSDRRANSNKSSGSRSSCGGGGDSGVSVGNFPALRMRSVVTVEEIDQLHEFKKAYFNGVGDDDSNNVSGAAQPFHNFGTDYLRFGAVKIFSDGSLGSRTAAMLEPYGDVEKTERGDIAGGGGGGGGDKTNSDDGSTCNGHNHNNNNSTCPCGTLLSSCEDLKASIRLVADAGLQCCTHAIGDRACQVIQDGYEACRADDDDDEPSTTTTTRPKYKGRDLRFRIEHCQHIASLAEIERYKKAGTIPSTQPCHLLFDGDHIASGRLGPARVQLAYAFRSMLARGVRPVFGTDWMVAPISPLSNIMAAVHRTPIVFSSTATPPPPPSSLGKGTDKKNDEVHSTTSSSVEAEEQGEKLELSTVAVWNPSECLTVEQSLTAYTTDAAYGMFAEDRVGRAEMGYFADFVVVDANPLTALSAEGGRRPLAGCTADGAQRPQEPINIVMTIVGGRVRYVAKGYEYLIAVGKASHQ